MCIFGSVRSPGSIGRVPRVPQSRTPRWAAPAGGRYDIALHRIMKSFDDPVSMTQPFHHDAEAPPALLLIGPTASGKTALALALAQRLPVEIISVDSALVFRDMDIGTAKPLPAERALCPHHLIDIVSPEGRYSAAQFRADAIRVMDEISARSRLPVLVGGTMLYFKALRDGLSDLPHADPEMRACIDADAARIGWPGLHAELARLDPAAAARLNPNDAQRIQRALEIVRLTGRPLAESYARDEHDGRRHRLVSIVLDVADRATLHARIARRFDEMLANGFLDEVRMLRARYALQADLPAMRCVGYRQAWSHLEGAIDMRGLRETGIAATRQLAKRQLTWQRQFRDTWPELRAIDFLAGDLLDQVLTVASRCLTPAPDGRAQ